MRLVLSDKLLVPNRCMATKTMKQLILLALTVVSSLISSLSPDKVLAQTIGLTCPTPGILSLSGKNNLVTTQQAQCIFTVNSAVPNIGVNISLGTPNLITGRTNPPDTNRTAQLSYSNGGNKSLDQNSSINDTFSGLTTTTMYLNMQIQRPNEFFAGSYLYDIIINITAL